MQVFELSNAISIHVETIDSVNEMHSIGNENCEHIIVLVYLIVLQVDSTSKHVH